MLQSICALKLEHKPRALNAAVQQFVDSAELAAKTQPYFETSPQAQGETFDTALSTSLHVHKSTNQRKRQAKAQQDGRASGNTRPILSDCRPQGGRSEGSPSVPTSSITDDAALLPVALAAETCQGEGSGQEKHSADVTPIPSFILVVDGAEGRPKCSARTDHMADGCGTSKALIQETRQSHRRNSLTTLRNRTPIKSPDTAIEDRPKTSLRRSRSANSCPGQKLNSSQHRASTPGTTIDPDMKHEAVTALPPSHRLTTAEVQSSSFDAIPFPHTIKAKLKHISSRDVSCTVLLNKLHGITCLQKTRPTSLHFGIQRVSANMLNLKHWKLSAPIEWVRTVVSPAPKSMCTCANHCRSLIRQTQIATSTWTSLDVPSHTRQLFTRATTGLSLSRFMNLTVPGPGSRDTRRVEWYATVSGAGLSPTGIVG